MKQLIDTIIAIGLALASMIGYMGFVITLLLIIKTIEEIGWLKTLMLEF